MKFNKTFGRATGRRATGVVAGAAVATLAVQGANAALVSETQLFSATPVAAWANPGVSTNVVVPGDTFNIAVVGFNSQNSGAYLTAAVDPVFGITNTYTGDALGGQVLTVTSSESFNLSAGTTTDLFTISVPTNFDPTGNTIGGLPVTSIEADIGAYNAGTDPVDFASNISNATITGQLIYNTNSVLNLNATGNKIFTNGGTSFGTAEGAGAGGADLAAFSFHSFSFNVTYPTVAVPEPASLGLAISVAGAGLMRRRRV